MGFSYNDITSKSMGLKARLTSWQVSGSLRNFTTTVPGKYGVTDFGADFDYREIVVSCSIFPRHSFSALVSTLDDIAAWLDPVGGLKQLVLGSSGSFDLTFFCPDPFGYAIEDETFSIAEEGNSTITRLIGNMESNPIYRIEGVITSGAGNSISITTNGQELKIVNATLASGETLVVDTDRMTAYVEDADGIILRNALPYLEELNFPTLAVGSNTVSVTAANATFTGLEIQARSRWR